MGNSCIFLIVEGLIPRALGRKAEEVGNLFPPHTQYFKEKHSIPCGSAAGIFYSEVFHELFRDKL
jgi:hypothetical protein